MIVLPGSRIYCYHAREKGVEQSPLAPDEPDALSETAPEDYFNSSRRALASFRSLVSKPVYTTGITQAEIARGWRDDFGLMQLQEFWRVLTLLGVGRAGAIGCCTSSG